MEGGLLEVLEAIKNDPERYGEPGKKVVLVVGSALSERGYKLDTTRVVETVDQVLQESGLTEDVDNKQDSENAAKHTWLARRVGQVKGILQPHIQPHLERAKNTAQPMMDGAAHIGNGAVRVRDAAATVMEPVAARLTPTNKDKRSRYSLMQMLEGQKDIPFSVRLLNVVNYVSQVETDEAKRHVLQHRMRADGKSST